MTPRAAPLPIAGAGDARAGTLDDPVLRAMEEPVAYDADTELERRATTVVSEEASEEKPREENFGRASS